MKMEVGGVGVWGKQFPLWRPSDGRMEYMNIEVGGGGGLGQAVSTMETFLKVSVAGVDR